MSIMVSRCLQFYLHVNLNPILYERLPLAAPRRSFVDPDMTLFSLKQESKEPDEDIEETGAPLLAPDWTPEEERHAKRKCVKSFPSSAEKEFISSV